MAEVPVILGVEMVDEFDSGISLETLHKKEETKMRTLFCCLILVAWTMVVVMGCSSADTSPTPLSLSMDGSVSSTSEALTQLKIENVTPGYTLLTTYTHFVLLESAGPNPPSTPNLVSTSWVCGQPADSGTYNTSTKTGTILMTSADCLSLINAVNADTATGTEYPQISLGYNDTTCNVTTHLCPLTSLGYDDGAL